MSGALSKGAVSETRLNECGQTTVFVLLALGLFLLGAVGFAVDIANCWFHRQTAQSAADAACTAAAMDMLLSAESVSPPAPQTSWGNFTPTAGSTFDCASLTTATPCEYAALNGYNGSGLVTGTASNSVKFSFPSSFTGVGSCSASPIPAICLPTFPALPVIQVNVGEAVRVFFVGMISGASTMNVGAQATCGVLGAKSAIPIVLLDPTGTSLSVGGSSSIAIYGGPSESIQVNSSSASAASCGTIDLSQGGPSLTGSSMGVFGGPATACSGFNGGSTGSWQYHSPPISDPFAQLAAPAARGTTWAGPYLTGTKLNGCPDSGGCDEYAAGYYPGGISVTNATAIFDPGVYYLVGGLSLASNSTVRPSTAIGDGSGGTMFYFSGSSTVSVNANSGKTLFPFSTTSGIGSLANGLKCTAGSNLPGNVPATLNVGNMLLAPCTGPYGDPLVAAGLTDPSGTQRGILFFQDRSARNVSPGWGGGGQFTLVGSMYFHSCNATGTGTGCGAAGTYYTDTFSFGGNSGSGSYVIGNIVTDNISTQGTPSITIDLNPSAAYWILKASLLQ